MLVSRSYPSSGSMTMMMMMMLMVVISSSLLVSLVAGNMPEGGITLPPVEIVRNGGFDDPVNPFNYYLEGSSGISSGPDENYYRSAPNSAHLLNKRTYFYQKLLSWTPSGCYDFSFYVRNAPGWDSGSNRFSVDFNKVELSGNEWMGDNAGPNLPLAKGSSGISDTEWKFYRFSRCITPAEQDEETDLRIKFEGAGYLVDDISVIGPYCESGSNLGFELGDLSCWHASGPNLGVINTVCGGTSAEPLSGEGNCYAKIGTHGTTPDTDPNQIERTDIAIQNPTLADRTHKVCARFRFSTSENGFAILLAGTNDFLTIRIRDAEGITISYYAVTAASALVWGGLGAGPTSTSTPWFEYCVYPIVPAGKTIFAKISAKVSNEAAGWVSDQIAAGRQSYGYVDGFTFAPL